jgi:hypothetical protein
LRYLQVLLFSLDQIRGMATRVARFFLTQYTKTVKTIPNYHNITKWTQSIPNSRKMFQMTIECTNIFHSRPLQNLPKFRFLVLKYNNWQPWWQQ